MDDVIDVSTGSGFSMALRSDGSLWTWGSNNHGQLGNGIIRAWDDAVHEPTKIMENIVAISAGSSHATAIDTDGNLWIWGRNFNGALGMGQTPARLPNSPEPLLVLENVVSVSAGRHHTLAIRDDGSLWAWGMNNESQIGTGSASPSRNTPVEIQIDGNVRTVVAGSGHSFAITSDGNLWAWGDNSDRGLGHDAVTAILHNPTIVMQDVIAVSSGSRYTMAQRTDGSLWVWGRTQPTVEGPRTDVTIPLTRLADGVRLP